MSRDIDIIGVSNEGGNLTPKSIEFSLHVFIGDTTAGPSAIPLLTYAEQSRLAKCIEV
jgi:hypothetical protein